MELALFDLDNTLLRGDSDHAWGEYLITVGAVNAEEQRRKNDQFMTQYENGTLNLDDFLDFQLQPFKTTPKSVLESWRKDFLRDVIRPMITDDARALVKHHQDRNDLIAVITATNNFITAPIVAEFGIPNLLATNLEEQNGQFTGHIVGTPTFQEGKVIRLREWLAKQGKTLEQFDNVYFYTDSSNDMPLLNAVNNPIAVNPDAKLEKHAREKGWRIIQLEKN